MLERISLIVCIIFGCTMFCLPADSAAFQQDQARPKTAKTDDDQIRKLVAQLGSDDFGQRQSAVNSLIDIGQPALEVLKENREAVDSEVRMQIVRIMRIIVQDQMNRQIRDFLSEKKSLPGWTTFVRIFGERRQYREDFAKLFRKHHEAISSLESSGEDVVSMIQSLELEFNQSRSKSLRGNEETYATICFLFAAFFEPPEDSGEAKDRAAGLSPSQIPTKLQLSIKDLFGNRQLHEMLSRKIYDYIVLDAMKVWISSGDGNITATPARLELARAHNLKHGLVPAELCIRSNKMSSAMLRDAIDMIARFGDTAHIALLEPLLENKIMLLRAKRPGSDGDLFETQVRDHALSAMVHLSGQKYSDFGFELGQRQDDERVLPYTLAGFRTDDERGAALKRWREFRSNNKMP